MKKIILLAALPAIMLVPASALARHGNDHKVKHRHGTVGTVTAYDADTGELTLTTKKGRAITALVTDATRLQCSDDASASASRHGGDDQGDDHGDDAPTHDQGDDDSTDCVPAVGDVVRRARIDLDGDDAVWTKLKF